MYKNFREQETTVDSLSPVLSPEKSSKILAMRATTVGKLIKIHFDLGRNYSLETLFLAIQILDRYMVEADATTLTRGLELFERAGMVAYSIASKYNETEFVKVCQLAALLDRPPRVRRQHMIEMETTVLQALNYQITVPTSHMFLSMILHKTGHRASDARVSKIAKTILLQTFCSHGLACEYLPSELAVGAIMIARKAVGWSAWSSTLRRSTGYTLNTVQPFARAMLKAVRYSVPSNLTAIQEEYASVLALVNLEKMVL
jgi:hypothetical protein